MTNKYYIKFGISNRKNAGSKAMRDVMHLLDEQGYRPMPAMPVSVHKALKLLVDIPLLVVTTLLAVRTRGCIIYAIPSNSLRIKIIAMLRRLLGFRMVCFINDIEQLRMPTSARYAKEEMESIALADHILAPNVRSIEILRRQYRISKPMTAVGVWDYLTDYRPEAGSNEALQSLQSEAAIAYAGNLRKSPFIYQLGAIPLHFNLWGDGADDVLPPNVHHQGAVMPDELPQLVSQCSWGLVWDGPYIESCEGQLGTYLRFNNAHKCGLYLAAGIPLIVWKESGMAHFVEAHRVGICIESITELPERLRSISAEAYGTMRRAAHAESQRIARGYYFLEALRRAERKNLTLLWRRLQPMEAGKDVILVPKYLGKALGYEIQVVCGMDEETLEKMPPDCKECITFVQRNLSCSPRQRIPVYIRYLMGHARKIDLLMCFHRKPETLVNLVVYKCLNWKGKAYVKLDTEWGKEWDISSKRGAKRWVHHLMNRLFLACCHTLSCETEQGYRYLTQQSAYAKLFAKKLVYLPNAFDEEALQSLPIEERRFEEKEQLMITVGRIGTAQKNTEMLLEAIQRIDLKGWRIGLIGPIEADFQPTIDQFYATYPHLKERVFFTGPLYEREVLWDWYNRAKVFVLTSTWESFGIVLTEAQRFRNYLISTEVGGASSLIQQGRWGTLIPQQDVAALADTMQGIIDQTVDINVYPPKESPALSYAEAIKPLAARLGCSKTRAVGTPRINSACLLLI